jgi:MFS family permease
MSALDGTVRITLYLNCGHLPCSKLNLYEPVPGLVFCFGLITLCITFVKSYEGMIVVRAILGIFEGGAMPGTAFFLSCFYKKTELFFRMSIFIASSSLASSFGGLLAAGLS